tara:strand:+ start:729 stop:1184 length:456 start_codon:yes stop_codon:yes gene_type:complete
MARPQKNTVDYFPHDCIKSRELSLLESKFGTDLGYRFYYQMLELLGRTPDHTLPYVSEIDRLYVSNQLQIEIEELDKIFSFAVDLKLLHSESFKAGLIYSEQLVAGVADVYKKRKSSMPCPPCTNENYDSEEVHEVSETDYDNIREIAEKI